MEMSASTALVPEPSGPRQMGAGHGGGPHVAAEPTRFDRLTVMRSAGSHRRAAALLGVPAVVTFAVVFGICAAFLPLEVAPGPAGGAAVLVVLLAWAAAPRVALWAASARPARRDEQARVENLLARLCAMAGVTQPEVWVAPPGAPGAMVVGRSERRCRIVVAADLERRLSRVELEGVLAREVVRVKAGDVVPATVGVVALGMLGVGCRWGARLQGRLASSDRAGAGDLAAVLLTRYPPALISALSRLVDDVSSAPAPGPRARLVAHMWTVPPEPVTSPRGAGVPPDFTQRIEALQEL